MFDQKRFQMKAQLLLSKLSGLWLLTYQFRVLDEAPKEVDQQTLQDLDDEWNRAQPGSSPPRGAKK